MTFEEFFYEVQRAYYAAEYEMSLSTFHHTVGVLLDKYTKDN
jgi:hypothetical protein